MRAETLRQTPTAMLSRGVCGVCKGALVVKTTPNPSFHRVDTIVSDADGRQLVTISTVMGH